MRKIQLECIIFRKKEELLEFLLLKRVSEKGGFWQPPCGGMEKEDKSELDAAYREIFEETGIKRNQIIKVIKNVHQFIIDKDYLTSEQIEPIKEIVYGFQVSSNVKITIENNIYVEHEKFRWVSFDEAIKMLKWKNNKEAFKKLYCLIK
jgi:8-oxo-dGTP pyrophosphatase MutT (NUDIX family)